VQFVRACVCVFFFPNIIFYIPREGGKIIINSSDFP
jgi:hypothetical protein